MAPPPTIRKEVIEMFLCKKCFTEHFKRKNKGSSDKDAEEQFDTWPGKSYGPCESCNETAPCLDT